MKSLVVSRGMVNERCSDGAIAPTHSELWHTDNDMSTKATGRLFQAGRQNSTSAIKTSAQEQI
jgi:hypothetical protein